MDADSQEGEAPRRKIRVFGYEYAMPRSRSQRVGIGVTLVVLGCFGWLPVLGFWMIPLGLLILSYEFAWVRRGRRKTVLWWGRRARRRRNGGPPRKRTVTRKTSASSAAAAGPVVPSAPAVAPLQPSFPGGGQCPTSASCDEAPERRAAKRRKAGARAE